MSSGFYTWSQTASSNASADASINWAEGQAPSSINDSARAMMAATAKYRDDIAGAIVTGGTSTAYTVTSYQVFDTLAHLNGQMIAFTPNATSTNAVAVDVTLNVDGLGAKPVRMVPSVTLPTGTLVSGSPYIAVYNSSDGVFYLHNTVNPYVIPLGAGMDFWGTTTPNSSFAFPTGQAISRTTYATLFSLLGTTFGTGDGSTTFNLPDKTGRVSAMKEATATRLTSAVGGVDGGTIGSAGGAQSQTLTLAQLPTGITATGSATMSSPTQLLGGTSPALTNLFASSTSASPCFNQFSSINLGTAAAFTPTLSASVTSNNTSGNAHPIVPPLIVCNYIIRII